MFRAQWQIADGPRHHRENCPRRSICSIRDRNRYIVRSRCQSWGSRWSGRASAMAPGDGWVAFFEHFRDRRSTPLLFAGHLQCYASVGEVKVGFGGNFEDTLWSGSSLRFLQHRFSRRRGEVVVEYRRGSGRFGSGRFCRSFALQREKPFRSVCCRLFCRQVFVRYFYIDQR